MDANKIAVLSNQLGGLDELENVIDVPAELLQKAINGEPLTRFEIEQVDEGLQRLGRYNISSDIALDHGIDLSDVNTVSDAAAFVDFQADADISAQYRQIIADGLLDFDDIVSAKTMFGELSNKQTSMMFDKILEMDAPDARDVFQRYIRDGESGGIFSKDLKDSEFWAWFREMFY